MCSILKLLRGGLAILFASFLFSGVTYASGPPTIEGEWEPVLQTQSCETVSLAACLPNVKQEASKYDDVPLKPHFVQWPDITLERVMIASGSKANWMKTAKLQGGDGFVPSFLSVAAAAEIIQPIRLENGLLLFHENGVNTCVDEFGDEFSCTSTKANWIKTAKLQGGDGFVPGIFSVDGDLIT